MADYLTPTQFGKTAAAKKPGATYSSYKTWVSKTRAKRAAASSADAKAPTPTPSYAPGSLQGQAQAMVMPQYQAAMQAIIDNINRSTRLGTNAIRGYTGEYLSQLPAIQKNIGSIYAGAKNEQSQLNAGLADLMKNQGDAATGALSAANATAGGTGAGVTQVAKQGAGALGAGAAYGGSTMGRLIGEGAANQAYAAELPAFGAAMGAQNMQQFLAQQSSAQQTQTSDLQSQLPGMVQSAYQTLLSRQDQMAQNAEQTRQFNANLAEQQKEAQWSHDQDMWARTHPNSKVTPQTAADWGLKLGDNVGAYNQKLLEYRYPSGLKTDLLGNPVINPKTGKQAAVGGRIAKWSVVRAKMTAAVKAQYPGAPPAVVKQFIDNLMRQAGWDPNAKSNPAPKKPPTTAAGGGGLQGPAGAPSGPTGPVGNTFSPNIGFPPVTNPLTDLQRSASSFWNLVAGQ